MNRLTETIAIAIVACAVAYFAAHLVFAGGLWVATGNTGPTPQPTCATYEDGSYTCTFPDGSTIGGCNPGAICND